MNQKTLKQQIEAEYERHKTAITKNFDFISKSSENITSDPGCDFESYAGNKTKNLMVMLGDQASRLAQMKTLRWAAKQIKFEEQTPDAIADRNDGKLA